MSKKQKLQRFGRYLILDHLVDGGMAKICRARFLGEEAEKIVAIKMVQPQLSSKKAFKIMFLDELKVTFSLQHPNIVQTYDYGYYKDQLFVAMEYCDGRNLKEYLMKLKQKKSIFPTDVATHIISQVCAGLHYAHNLTNKLSGKKHTVIHRDISPHNIMLTFDGSVKIIDFGIAKSDTKVEHTKVGTIKGKLSYLAPEYIEGKELDHRYDQFALGVTFWEMLCGRKLFKANNDIAILKKIQDCQIPRPSEINPKVCPELDDIVMKSLSRNREDRFEDLDKMNRALIKVLNTKYSDFSPLDLGYFSKGVFKEEIKKDREKLYEFGKIDLAPFLKELEEERVQSKKEDKAPPPPKETAPKDTAPKGPPKHQGTIQLGDGLVVESSSDALGEFSRVSQHTGQHRNATGLRTSARLSIDGTSHTRIKRTGNFQAPLPLAKNRTRKKSSSYHNIGEDSQSSPLKKVAIVCLGLACLFLLFDHSSKDHASGKNLPQSVTQKNGRRALQGPSKLIKLKNINNRTDRVYVNGKETPVDALGKVEIPLEGRVSLRVQRDGMRHFIKDLSGKMASINQVVVEEMPSESYGFLKTSRNCASGDISFSLFGEKRVETIPIKKEHGIWIPVRRSEGRNLASEITVTVKLHSESFERKIPIQIKNIYEVIDLCELIQ